jgi:ATP-dependent Zn protease
VAFHEAGHAVVDTLLGREVKYVDLVQYDTGRGYSNGKTVGADVRIEEFLGKGKAGAMPFLIGLMAGTVAEAKVNADAWSQSQGSLDRETAEYFAVGAICEPTSSTDDGGVIFSKEQVSSKEGEINEVFNEALNEATRLVDANLEAVTRVAERLLRRGKLTGSEVAAIVAECRKGEDQCLTP